MSSAEEKRTGMGWPGAHEILKILILLFFLCISRLLSFKWPIVTHQREFCSCILVDIARKEVSSKLLIDRRERCGMVEEIGCIGALFPLEFVVPQKGPGPRDDLIWPSDRVGSWRGVIHNSWKRATARRINRLWKTYAQNSHWVRKISFLHCYWHIYSSNNIFINLFLYLFIQ